jgi:hypothetical protein
MCRLWSEVEWRVIKPSYTDWAYTCLSPHYVVLPFNCQQRIEVEICGMCRLWSEVEWRVIKPSYTDWAYTFVSAHTTWYCLLIASSIVVEKCGMCRLWSEVEWRVIKPSYTNWSYTHLSPHHVYFTETTPATSISHRRLTDPPEGHYSLFSCVGLRVSTFY